MKNAISNNFLKIWNCIYKYRNVFLTLIIILIVLSTAFTQIYPSAKFYPINGNFQNYNVVRRLLSGQIPYKDFTVYLGPLHLYLGSFLTLLFGNNFIASVFSYNILALISVILLSVTLGKSLKFSYTKTCTLIISMFCIALLVVNKFSLENSHLSGLAGYLLYSKNSSRLIRALPLFLGCLFIIPITKYTKKNLLKNFLYGTIAGFAFPCSNDYGISTFIAITITVLFLNILEQKSFVNLIKSLFSFSAGCILSLFLTITLFSQGHLLSWYQTTFGQGSYQSWYFIGNKTFYIYQFNLKFLILIQIIFTIIIGYKLYSTIKDNNDLDIKIKYLILFLLNFTASIAVQEINFFGDRTCIIPELIFLVTLFYYFSEKIFNYTNQRYFPSKQLYNWLVIALVFISIFYIILNIKFCLYQTKNKIKIPELGGSINKYGTDVLNAQKFIGKEKIFSTYSSALEVVTNQFQPSGYDYIIHVLGNQARKHYMNTFRNRNFKYVTIQNIPSTHAWEYWIKNANWYFYRELYRYYDPVYANKYLTIYEYSKNQDYYTLPQDTKIKTIKISDNMYKIVILTSKSTSGLADINIDYTITNINKFLKPFMFRSLLRISYLDLYRNITNKSNLISYIYLPSEQTINIPIVNGYGELTINSEPIKNVKLNINSIKLGKYYKTPMKYILIDCIKNDMLIINNNIFNKSLIFNTNKINIADNEYTIIKRFIGTNSILIKLNKKIIKSNGLLELIN